mgnify:CR=1 FL=1
MTKNFQKVDFKHQNDKIDLVIKAAVAHLWFVTIHPLQEGNGRITRALTDMLLAQSDKSTQRFYSMSAQIRIERKQYYEILQRVQHSSGDITEWLDWFLLCLKNSILASENTLQKTLIHSKMLHFM